MNIAAARSCPWCDVKALSVNHDLRLFHCFACGEGGTLTKLALGPMNPLRAGLPMRPMHPGELAEAIKLLEPTSTGMLNARGIVHQTQEENVVNALLMDIELRDGTRDA